MKILRSLDFDFMIFTSPKARVLASADAFMWSLICNFLNTPGKGKYWHFKSDEIGNSEGKMIVVSAETL